MVANNPISKRKNCAVTDVGWGRKAQAWITKFVAHKRLGRAPAQSQWRSSAEPPRNIARSRSGRLLSRPRSSRRHRPFPTVAAGTGSGSGQGNAVAPEISMSVAGTRQHAFSTAKPCTPSSWMRRQPGITERTIQGSTRQSSPNRIDAHPAFPVRSRMPTFGKRTVKRRHRTAPHAEQDKGNRSERGAVRVSRVGFRRGGLFFRP